MSKRVVMAALLMGLFMGVTHRGEAAEWLYTAYPQTESMLSERLEIGVRISYFSFRDPTRRSDVPPGAPPGGYTPDISIYTLGEQQDWFPYPYVRYNFTPFVGAQLGWERLEGSAETFYDRADGNAVLKGPSLSLYGRYPLERQWGYPWDHVTPFAALGAVFFSGSFDHDSGWHAGGLRNIKVDDEIGFLFTLGASIAIVDQFAIDLLFSHIRARPDAAYWMRGDRGYRAEWQFPMDSWVYQIGAKYTF